MQTVKIAVSYMNNGKCVTSSYEMKTKDSASLFNNAVADANVFAHLHGGQVLITQKVNSLYINYLDVKGCELVDRMFLIQN